MKSFATRGRPEERLEHKVELTRQLLAKGYDETKADEIFLLIDWMMVLPEAAEITRVRLNLRAAVPGGNFQNWAV